MTAAMVQDQCGTTLSFLGPTKSVFVSLEGGVGGIVDISVRLNLLWHVNEVFSSF